MRSASDDLCTSTHSNPTSGQVKMDFPLEADHPMLEDPLEESFAAMSVVDDEQQAATQIQRMMRGCLHRWQYLITKRENQLMDILCLQTKQLKKIRERQGKTKQWIQKRQHLDTTKSQRKLARAKKAIQFLLKEEKGQKAERARLQRDISNCQKGSNEDQHNMEELQQKVTELEQQQRQLQGTVRQYQQALAATNNELGQVEVQIQQECTHKEQLQQCIANISEKAGDSLPPTAKKCLGLSDSMRELTIDPTSLVGTMMQQ